MPNLISREPWWATRPEPGQSDRDVEWGYLEHFDDGSFNFDHTRPSDAEILNRKSCRIPTPSPTKKAS
ncbi:hypothetical protein Q1Z72_01585 [Pseudomonas qingdaonensis]|nr:hypothetical protein [Pseudomonas qingdaonensis]UXH55909.1 hypothetical protein N5876_32700 [Pseudomonas aeruginosa]UXH68953.1 hypothetical protein N5879_32825 [Pseudomonas aeruginosa]WKL67387.1 hypothetical protein Q1Z72_01585 [Pseudomonas qingdaonensis]